MTFAATITAARRHLDLTQAQLAALVDVDKQSVSNWECGRNEPWPARQADICRKLKINPPVVRRARVSINERILGT